jgi:hypothetical protein
MAGDGRPADRPHCRDAQKIFSASDLRLQFKRYFYGFRIT